MSSVAVQPNPHQIPDGQVIHIPPIVLPIDVANGIVSTSLYVGDLHPDVNEAILFEIFNSMGPVASLRVCRENETRKSLGYAYVNFYSASDAERALENLNHYEVKGRTIRVMWSQRDPALRKSGVGNIYIKNLEISIDSKTLYDTFSRFGHILSCKVVPNGASSYGFVHYETEEAANSAIQKLDGKLLNGLKVFVGPFLPKKLRQKDTVPKEMCFSNVFIRNFPESWATEDLEKKFSHYGNITSCIVMFDATGKSRGFGFANYSDATMARRAVEEGSNLEVDGKTLYVARAQKKQERQKELQQKFLAAKRERAAKYQGANLYIKNLTETIDDVRLREAFSNFGNITSCKVMYDEKNIHKGFGFVCYETPEEASKALTGMNNTLVDGKPLYVALAQPKEERRRTLAEHYAARATGSMRLAQPGLSTPYPPNVMYYHPQPNMQPPQTRGGVVFPGRPYIRPANYYMAAAPLQSMRTQRGGGSSGSRRATTIPPLRIAPHSIHSVSSQQARPPLQVQRHHQPTASELNASILAELSEAEQRDVIGNQLFHIIVVTHGDLAAKITGMLLEMDISELLHLLESSESLSHKVSEAVAAIDAHNEQMKAQAGRS